MFHRQESRCWVTRTGRRGLLLALFLFANAVAQADPSTEPLLLRDSVRSVELWPAVTLLYEADASRDVDAIIAAVDSFKPPATPYANLGLREGAAWLRVPLEVPPGESGRWLFDLDYPSIDRIDLFVIEAGRVARHIEMGDHLAFDQRPLPTRSHAAPLRFEPGHRYALLLRVQTTSTMVLPMSLKRADAFYADEAPMQSLQGLLAGVWLCLCLYSVTQWLNLRDAMFAFYATAIVGTGLFFASYFGVGAQHLWRGSTWMTQNMAPLGVLIGLIGGLLFIDRALDVRSLNRYASLTARALAGAAGATALALMLDLISYGAAQSVATALGLSPMLLAVPVAYIRWRQGDRASIYMLCGWLIYALGAAHQALLLRGVIGSTFWTQHAFQFGSVAEMLLWMMVLGARVDEIRTKAEQDRRERDLLHSLAHTDALTGLLNRRGLQSALEGVLKHAHPTALTSIYLLDLDGFKPVNDRFGHDAGDELLRQVGGRLKAQLRGTDLVARLGGDEFVVAASSLSGENEAGLVGGKMLRAFQHPFEVTGQQCTVGLTIGYAIAPLDGRDLQSLLKRADAAMYAGKQAGKNRVQRGGASAGLVTC